ncbi:hypothetical protein N0V84_000054 [Fusarium piperis]|uniref:Uncharacterized protein n=1 Tax=Fusarium piperis TaxID=1435070 RepID=A0A9W9BTU9_9HYPO|nr:hypothetical protein N0V84_000054 [Fusarium piperis]
MAALSSLGQDFWNWASPCALGHPYQGREDVTPIGYLITCYPLAFLVVKLPFGKVLVATMVGWATVLLCTVSLKNVAGHQPCSGEQASIKNSKFKVDQALDSLSLIIKGISFSQLRTILLKIATYGFQAIFIGMGIVGCKYMKNANILWICIFNIICISGGLMVRLLPVEKI